MKYFQLLLIVCIVHGGQALDPLPRKIWFARKVTDDYFVSGRPNLREIKYASESGVKTIVSVFPYDTRQGEDAGIYLPSTEEARSLSSSLGITHETILAPGDSDWQSVSAVARLRDIVRTAPKPVLVHCDVSFASSFILLSHFFNVTHHGDVRDGELALTGNDVFERAATYGFSFGETNLTYVLRELSRDESAKYYTTGALVSFPMWFMGYWPVKPVTNNWYISGQIQRHHLPIINASWDKIESKNGVVYPKITIINVRGPGEEVTLLNVRDNTGPDRQVAANLESSRIDPSKPNSYISQNATRNYEMENRHEFGDSIGYSEALEQEEVGKFWPFINYIDLPIYRDTLLTVNGYRHIRDELKEADQSSMVIVHSASESRSGLLAYLAAADLKAGNVDDRMKWANLMLTKYMHIGLEWDEISMIRSILELVRATPDDDPWEVSGARKPTPIMTIIIVTYVVLHFFL